MKVCKVNKDLNNKQCKLLSVNSSSTANKERQTFGYIFLITVVTIPQIINSFSGVTRMGL